MLIHAEVGGCGLEQTERLIRFDKTSEWTSKLLNGQLSLTNVRILANTDPREAARTNADDQRARAFYGGLAEHEKSRNDARLRRMRADTYVNCWHRYSPTESDLPRLIREYSSEVAGFAVETTVRQLYAALNGVTDLGKFLEFVAVQYIGETDRSNDSLSDVVPPLYPELKFKRREPWHFEREARVMLHSGTAELVSTAPMTETHVRNEQYRYVDIDPSMVITKIYQWGPSVDQPTQHVLSANGLLDRSYRTSPSHDELHGPNARLQ